MLLLVNIFGFDNLFEKANLIVCIKNSEVGFQADEFGVDTQDFRGNGMEGAKPRQAFGGLPE